MLWTAINTVVNISLVSNFSLSWKRPWQSRSENILRSDWSKFIRAGSPSSFQLCNAIWYKYRPVWPSSMRLATGWETPELSKSDDTLTNWGLTLEVRGTTGCTRVLGDGIGATEHEWGCWSFGATEHLYPYRMKCGLGGSVAQNTTAISSVVSFSLIFLFWFNYVVLVWRMNANRLIWPY